MVKIRYGNDIPISWTINRNDKAEDFTLVKSLRLLMTSISSSVEITDYVIEGNVIKWMFWGKDQKAPATYRFTLIENAGQEGMFTIDACNALALVGTSCAADDCDGPFEVSVVSNINDKGVTCTSAITLPSNGLSAYEIAVLHGFKGSEEEWLASLKGEKGDAFTYDDFTQEEIADLKKPAVDAAKQAMTATEEARNAATEARKATTAANDAAQNIEQNLSEKQDKTDNTLQTSDKTVVGGINEANTKAADAPTLALRKLYIEAGAVYNEETGYYELNGLTDITEEQILAIYNEKINISDGDLSYKFFSSNIRTNIAISYNDFGYSNDLNALYAFSDSDIEVVSLGIRPAVWVENMMYCFQRCAKLKRINTILYDIGDKNTNVFYRTFLEAPLLEYVHIKTKHKISFQDSPLINYESVSYLIANAANTSAITVTVHPTTYSYLTGTAQPTEQVGGTSEQWQAILTTASERQITFTTT